MSRKQPKRRAGKMVRVAIAGFFILAIAGGVGFGAASADSSDELARNGAFGFDEATHQATLHSSTSADGASARDSANQLDQSALASASMRDITAGLQMVDEREAAEEARKEAENAAAIERVAAEKSKQGVVSAGGTASDASARGDAAGASRGVDVHVDGEQAKDSVPEEPVQEMEYDLPAVDWSVGKDAFIAEWASRIDSYLEGFPLAGYGSVFAEAAWDNGVDPRWSPAISNTESTKGSHCFLPHNAWGWGASSWADWGSAIREHVAGLATVYGYSLTPQAAAVYCPPNHVNWYNTTLSQMALM